MTDAGQCNGGGGNKTCFELEERCQGVNFHNNNNNNNNNIEPTELHPLTKKINANYKFPVKAGINLEFSDIRYTVRKWALKLALPETKEILHGVSGQFLSNKLTAIMGPSGAGKSTLLNILAAYVLRGASGSVRINNKERSWKNPKDFKRLCCYIQQDDFLRMELKVYEAMNYSADLKLGTSVSKELKGEQITELLKMLGLLQCWDTPTSGLSGGQKKRLSVALELISNPSIIFLDEPTTGLDSSSCSQCVSLLKLLAQQGRTVICTIHQPSALIFEMFDDLYALSAGECIYSGEAKNLIGYLADLNLECPKYHNPADFLMEIASGECGADLSVLVAKAKESFKKRKQIVGCNGTADGEIDFKKSLKRDENYNDDAISRKVPKIKRASFLYQFWLLTCRKLLMVRRKPNNLLMRGFAHLLIAMIFGYLYQGVGAKASTVLANYCYLYGSNLLLVYTGKMSVTLLFPLELNIVSREHFNRWYKLGPYYLSMILYEIPVQVLCCILYIPVSYHLTGQPFEQYRLLNFSIIVITASLAAQAFGFFLGITTPKKIAVFIGPVFACLLSVFGFCLRFADTPVFFRWLYFISYFRASFQTSVFSMYGFNRTTLNCEDFYCHFKNPKKLLTEMDMPSVDLESNYIIIGLWIILLHISTILVVWHKLNRK